MDSNASLRRSLMALVRQAQHCLEATGSRLAATVSDAGTAADMTGDTQENPADLLAGIRSVLTVLGMDAPNWGKMTPEDVAKRLVVLELQLEDETHSLAEPRPGYSDLSVGHAGRRLRALYAGCFDETVAQLDALIHEPADEKRVRALLAGLTAAGRLRSLSVILPSMFKPDDCHVVDIQRSAFPTQVIVVMARRELATVGCTSNDDQTRSDVADELLRRLCLLGREGLQGDSLIVGEEARLLEDCRLYSAQRRRTLRARFATVEADSELSACFQRELREELAGLREQWKELSDATGLRYLCDWHCTRTSRLTTVVLMCGDVARYDLLEALRLLMCWMFEHSVPLRHEELALFDDVCVAALTTRQDVDFEALEVRLADALYAHELSVGDSGAVVRLYAPGESAETLAEIAVGQLPVYLAQNIHRLLTAERDIGVCDWHLEFAALNRQLLVELRMLATGARTLRVYRVEALSSALAEVHQMLDRQRDKAIEADSIIPLLMEAHRSLCSSLNCAAAYQEVPDFRDLIASLYRWLDAQTGAANDHAHNKDGAELAACFQREAVELMERIEQSVSSLCQSEAVVPVECPDLLSLLHTLKGAALQFDSPEIGTLCHGFEQLLLQRSESHSVFADECLVDAVLTWCHQLQAAVDDLGVGHGTPLIAIPVVATPTTSALTVPAQSMERIAMLAELTRSDNREVLDVLAGINIDDNNAPRLLLLRDLLEEQRRHAIQLGEEIAGSRLIRFHRLSARLQRLVARHANLLNRQVRLRVQGEQLQIDRLLLERLVAPIEHLLRNAIDHGLESVEERRAASKPDCGSITLTIVRQEPQLRIELADDGRGVDIGDSMPVGCSNDEGERERRLQRIFDSGFSTRTEATTQSGHGLGLTAVRNTITALGGSIRVSSSPGTTCFHIALPV